MSGRGQLGSGGYSTEQKRRQPFYVKPKHPAMAICMPKGPSRCRVTKSHPRVSLGIAMILWMHMDVHNWKPFSQSGLKMAPSSF